MGSGVRPVPPLVAQRDLAAHLHPGPGPGRCSGFHHLGPQCRLHRLPGPPARRRGEEKGDLQNDRTRATAALIGVGEGSHEDGTGGLLPVDLRVGNWRLRWCCWRGRRHRAGACRGYVRGPRSRSAVCWWSGPFFAKRASRGRRTPFTLGRGPPGGVAAMVACPGGAGASAGVSRPRGARIQGWRKDGPPLCRPCSPAHLQRELITRWGVGTATTARDAGPRGCRGRGGCPARPVAGRRS